MNAIGGRLRNLRAREDGNAVIEFLIIGVLVLIPMAYLVLCLMRVQAATFASTQAVREAGRAFNSADSVSQGQASARTAARLAFSDQGFDLPESALGISCPDSPCLAPGSVAEVSLNWQVMLPWVPAGLSREFSVPIEVLHQVPVDDYRVNE
ncbi:MAG: pilus assembly protein [Candidatus Nanopelagicales bacterium]|nr:pilus assembly protein [Candidatus Nanopelagicales bacterium]